MRTNINIPKIQLNLLNKREFFMGVAMIMIVLFHSTGGSVLEPLFSRGYYGVDIFLFLSAVGLCFSFNKHSRKEFYIRRAERILPLFFLLAVFRIIWFINSGGECSLWCAVATLTGLSYLKIFGGIWVDWYLCALIILYALFPLFYKFFRKLGWGGYVLMAFVATLFCALPTEWDHRCLMGRLPIFSLGILFYLHIMNTIYWNKRILAGSIIYGVLLFIFDVLITNGRTMFLAPAFITPLILVAISLSIDYIQDHLSYIYIFIVFIGSKTLEIYVANCIAGTIMHQGFHMYGVKSAIVEILLTCLFTPILWLFNRGTSILFEKRS